MSQEKPEAKTKPLYDVRRVHIGKNAYVQELSHECSELYSRTLVFFWRTVRRKGIWLKSKHLMRLFTSPKLHAIPRMPVSRRSLLPSHRGENGAKRIHMPNHPASVVGIPGSNTSEVP